MFTHVRLPDADCYRDRSRLLCSYCRNTCPGEVQRARHFLAFDLCLQWSCSSDRSSSKMHKVLPLPRKSSSRYTKRCACHAKAVGPRRRVQVLHCRSQQLAVMNFNKCHEHPSKACQRKQIHFVRVATQVQGSYRRNTCQNCIKCEQSGKNWPVRTDSDSKASRHLPAPAEEETSIELRKLLQSKSTSEKQAFSNNDLCFQMQEVLHLPRNKTFQRVQVLHLPRKSSSRCTKCCACHVR